MDRSIFITSRCNAALLVLPACDPQGLDYRQWGTFFNGEGETVYEFVPPDTLAVTETWNATGQYANNGNPGGTQHTYTATLRE